MKKMAAHIGNKRGSMLMFTLIVFMVILILGMTMITSMLYSQGENNMQINEQKAYYAAQSVVDVVKAYFLNPELYSSTKSPDELIGGDYTYDLKAQGIDEDTTVELSIKRDTADDQYILIKATGTNNGEKSTVTAKMRQEVKEGSSGGLYSSEVVFGCNEFIRNNNNQGKLNVEGNIFINNNSWASQTIMNIDLTGENIKLEGDDKKYEGGDLFIYGEGKGGTSLAYNNLRNVFFKSDGSIYIGGQNDPQKANEINNIYIKKINEYSGGTINCQSNIIKGEAQFFIGNANFDISNNKSIEKDTEEDKNTVRDKNIEELIVSVNSLDVHTGNIYNNEVDKVYIRGANKLDIDGKSSTKPIQALYTDAKEYVNYPFDHINEIINKDLSGLDAHEKKIDSVMESFDQLSEVLEGKDTWTIPDAESGFIKLEPGEGEYVQDSVNKQFLEYYNPYTKVRLVFTKDKTYCELTKRSSSGVQGDYNHTTYFISNEDKYAGDQIFFIAEKATTINFSTSSGDSFEALYVYAPQADYQFNGDFSYLKGSIIARRITINTPSQGTLIFREPENIEGIGVPGGTGSTGSSSGTTYIYHFEEYIENDKE